MAESIAFIGGGNMATAMVKGLLRSGWASADLTVIERDEAKRTAHAGAFDVRTFASLGESSDMARVVIWAVKPDALEAVATAAASQTQHALHISIAAGIATAQLCRWLQSGRAIRAMPNTAAMVSSAVTGLCAGSAVTAEDKGLAERVFGAIGAVFWVAGDERVDAVTAVSGSGPAYVFHFIEGLQQAASALGFEATQARELALRVVEGALRQAQASDEPLSTLRERVTSKGGTTAAALEVLDRYGTRAAMVIAVQAAYARAGEISVHFRANEGG